MLKRSGTGIITISLLLAACGGSGSGGTSSLTYTGSTAEVTIDESNADSIAGYTTDSVTSSYDTSTAVTGVASTGTLSQSSALPTLGELTNKLADLALSAKPSADNLAVGVTDSSTEQCNVSGTMSYQLTYSDPYQDNTGDSMYISFNNCIMDASNDMMNGAFTLTLTEVRDRDAYGDAIDFTATMTYNNMALTYANGDYFKAHGGYSFSSSGDGFSTDKNTYMYGDSLVYALRYGAITESMQLTAFSYSYVKGTDQSLTIDNDYTVASTMIGGSITVETIFPVYIAAGALHPTAGEIEITGANSARVYVTVLSDGSGVYIDYDLDGNGTYGDGTDPIQKFVAWGDL